MKLICLKKIIINLRIKVKELMKKCSLNIINWHNSLKNKKIILKLN